MKKTSFFLVHFILFTVINLVSWSLFAANTLCSNLEGTVVRVVVPECTEVGFKHMQQVKWGVHMGIDIWADGGTPIYPMANGTVTDVIIYGDGVNETLGNGVIVRHPDLGGEGVDLYTIYLHMQEEPSVSVGQAVTPGTQLGLVGHTGFGDPIDHTHFEIRHFPDRISPVLGNIYCKLDDCESSAYVAENWEDPLTFNLGPLYDVVDDAWYAEIVKLLYAKEIIHGYFDGSFKPGNEVNRVEFTKMLIRSLEVAEETTLPETGVVPGGTNGEWYASSLKKAYGYTNPNYNDELIGIWDGPPWDQAITRSEAVHMLMNAKKLEPVGWLYEQWLQLFHFNDVPVSSTEADWVYACKKAGIIDGYSDNTFRPDQILNRAEAAKVLCTAFFADECEQ